MTERMLHQFAEPDAASMDMLRMAMERLKLSGMHRTSHTPEYSEYVYNKVKDAQTRDELIALLSEIKHELYNGKLNLQGPAQGINKNS